VCGRAYQTYSDEELSFRYLSKKPEISLGFSPIYNLCPTQNSPVLRVLSGERQLEWMRWQLVPSTEPTFTTTLSTINARSEGIFQSRLYRDLIYRKRCIVPLSGFFEWKRADNVKRPFKIFLRDEAIMSIAGIWDTWRPGSSQQRDSFSIVTTSANEFMAGIHDRMPVILDRSAEAAWLDPELRDRDALQELFKPCPSSWLDAVEVSTLVNSTRNNSPDVLKAHTFVDESPRLV
jgi:putative SOS response-associated peptidase YedK